MSNLPASPLYNKSMDSKGYAQREKARLNKSGGWFYHERKSSETGILPEAELHDAPENELDEDEYAHEMTCSLDAALRGAYYGKLVNKAEEEGRFQPFEKSHDYWAKGGMEDVRTRHRHCKCSALPSAPALTMPSLNHRPTLSPQTTKKAQRKNLRLPTRAAFVGARTGTGCRTNEKRRLY